MHTKEEVLNVDALANEIRRIDGRHSLGAGEIAELLMPFISRAYAALLGNGPVGWRDTVSRVLTVLDKATGDTDPNIAMELTDDDIRGDYPLIWSCQQLAGLLAIPDLCSSVRGGWKWVPIEPTREMFIAASKVDDQAYIGGSMHGADDATIWAAMIEAAPQQENE